MKEFLEQLAEARKQLVYYGDDKSAQTIDWIYGIVQLASHQESYEEIRNALTNIEKTVTLRISKKVNPDVKSQIAELKTIGTPEACFVSDLLTGWISKCKVLFDTDSESCCIHDYAAVSQAIDPDTVTDMRPEICHVDISGGMCDGMLVVDRRVPEPVDSPVRVVYHMDAERTHALLRQLLAK